MMVIGGLQKLSLLDYPDKTCATIFTRGCNFCCPFCQNASLVRSEEGGGAQPPAVEAAEVLAFLKKRRGLLDAVCISGGEPLLQPGLEEFIREVRALGYLVKLDTNGSRPDELKRLLVAGLLDYVAMDIKSSPQNYGAAIGRAEYDAAPVLESVQLLRAAAVQHEFRTTVVKPLHTEEDFAAIGAWLAGTRQYYLQGFEDSGDILGEGMSAFAPAKMQAFLEIVRRQIPAARLRGQ